jgi:cytochrome P450
LNSSLHFLLGIDPSEEPEQAPDTPERFIENFHAAVLGTGLRIMLGRFRNLAPKAAYIDVCRRAHEYIEYYIGQALADSSLEEKSVNTHAPYQRQCSLVQNLATQTDDMKFIRSQILQGMMAAQETISVLVSNTMFLMARHPSEWTQLRAEVLSGGEDLFNFHELSTFKPLQNILSEGMSLYSQQCYFYSQYSALRLYPVFPMLGRTCLQDTTLPMGGGKNQDEPIYVKKGTFVVTSYIAMHMDPRVFGKSPELFRPSRWNEIRPLQWEYMPFGGGERACLGREKVLAEAAYVIARFAQTFSRVESRDDRPWKEIVRMTAKNANGCLVGLFAE